MGLWGLPKEKGAMGVLMRSLARRRERFGRVNDNLGEPIHLDRLLERHAPDWRTGGGNGQERPRWVGPLVDELAGQVMQNINAAAAVTPVNLLALALLATPRHMALASELQLQLDTLLAVLRLVPYSDRVTLTELSASAIVDYGLRPRLITGATTRAGEC